MIHLSHIEEYKIMSVEIFISINQFFEFQLKT